MLIILAVAAGLLALANEFSLVGVRNPPEAASALKSFVKSSLGVDGDIGLEVSAAMDKCIVSPLSGVADGGWTRFVELFRGRTDEVTDACHFGAFNVGFLRLRDLGLAVNVRQTDDGGRRRWVGQFKAPLTVARFLASPSLQYQVFSRDMIDRARLVRPYIGRKVGTSTATLSGLLAVAKLAGTKGFSSWVEDADERSKHVKTTAAFHVANGIF